MSRISPEPQGSATNHQRFNLNKFNLHFFTRLVESRDFEGKAEALLALAYGSEGGPQGG